MANARVRGQWGGGFVKRVTIARRPVSHKRYKPLGYTASEYRAWRLESTLTRKPAANQDFTVANDFQKIRHEKNATKKPAIGNMAHLGHFITVDVGRILGYPCQVLAQQTRPEARMNARTKSRDNPRQRGLEASKISRPLLLLVERRLFVDDEHEPGYTITKKELLTTKGMAACARREQRPEW
ncbi:hypothetical protein BDZ89DRAFT_1039435 [Hymenopellis radicata]|nr:hypothetical protein BDZ89DRAFT_1039435 [Hymenopellis radicata]